MLSAEQRQFGEEVPFATFLAVASASALAGWVGIAFACLGPSKGVAHWVACLATVASACLDPLVDSLVATFMAAVDCSCQSAVTAVGYWLGVAPLGTPHLPRNLLVGLGLAFYFWY